MYEIPLNMGNYSITGFSNLNKSNSSLNLFNLPALANSAYQTDRDMVFNYGSNVDIIENTNNVGKFVSFVDSTTNGKNLFNNNLKFFLKNFFLK